MSKERILNFDERIILRKRIGELIRKKRRDIQLSQEDLGFESGLHRTYIGAAERGETNLTAESLAVIAITLRCEISDLLPSLRDVRREVSKD